MQIERIFRFPQTTAGPRDKELVSIDECLIADEIEINT
jgi:hypothetical protein